MKWAEALAALDRLPATCDDKASDNASSTSGGRLGAPEATPQVPAGSPSMGVVQNSPGTLRDLPSFWELDVGLKKLVLVVGNGLLQQLEVNTSSLRIRKSIMTKMPLCFEGLFSKYPEDTEIEKLMADLTLPEKRIFRRAMIQALGDMTRDAKIDEERTARFFARFDVVFTVNIDLLQPKVFDLINHDSATHQAFFQDAFEMKGRFGTWSKQLEQNWFYPHGNVILARTSFPEEHHKMTLGILQNMKNLDRLLMELRAESLVILDSDSSAKLENIEKSTYLRRCMTRLAAVKGMVCFYGLGIEKDTDKHLWTAVDDNKGVDDILIAVKAITRKTLADVERLLPKRHRRVIFFARDSI